MPQRRPRPTRMRLPTYRVQISDSASRSEFALSNRVLHPAAWRRFSVATALQHTPQPIELIVIFLTQRIPYPLVKRPYSVEMLPLGGGRPHFTMAADLFSMPLRRLSLKCQALDFQQSLIHEPLLCAKS